MKDLGDNTFETESEEQITIYVTVDKEPYMCVFEDPPHGTTWSPKPERPTPKTEKRYFAMAKTKKKGKVYFVAAFDTQIADDDDSSKATYTLTFNGSAPGSESPKRTVVVPKDAGPIPMTYTFTVKED